MLQKSIGIAFASLAVLTMLFNVLFDTSPQAFFNVVENSIMAVVFIASTLRDSKIFKGVQIALIVAGAFISFKLSETPFFGIAMINVAIVLLYAYGGYRTFVAPKIVSTILVIFSLSFLAIADFIAISPETFVKSLVWTSFVCVFWVFQWLVVKDIEKTFYLNMKTRLDLNTVEIQNIKKEVGDGTKET
jgi:hypothetical protein